MKDVFTMAGYYASYAAHIISTQEKMLPFVATLNKKNEQSTEQILAPHKDVLEVGSEKLKNLSEGNIGAAFILSAYVGLRGRSVSAIMIDLNLSNNVQKQLKLIIPYTHIDEGIAIHPLQLVNSKGFEENEIKSSLYALMDGIMTCDQGAELWKNNFVDLDELLDESESTADEILNRAPLIVFFLIAAADGVVDRKELKAFIKVMSRAHTFGSETLANVAQSLEGVIPEVVSEIGRTGVFSGSNLMEELAEIRIIADTNLDENEALAFKRALYQLAKEVAEASGGGFFGFGNKIDENEALVIEAIESCFNIK